MTTIARHDVPPIDEGLPDKVEPLPEDEELPVNAPVEVPPDDEA